MVKKTVYFIVFISVFILSSCDAFEDFTIEKEEKVPLVVEGILIPDIQPTICLSELSDLGDIQDTAYIPVTNAKVRLYHKGQKYNLILTDAQSGTFSYVDNSLNIVAGESYSLEIDYLDRTVSAETIVPYAVSDISLIVEPASERNANDILNISWEAKDDSYFYLFLESDTNNVSEPIFYYSEYPFAENNYLINASNLYEGDTYYLLIYSLSHDYAQYYFRYDPLNSNYVYESNVNDAYGIFTGLNINHISFVYQKDLNIKLTPKALPDFLLRKKLSLNFNALIK